MTLAYFRDITDRKRLEEKLYAASIMDELTSPYNRRGFLVLAAQQLRIAQRARKAVSVLFIDLDEMKKINDTLGHREGDSALTETARILRKTFRESDILGRIGGDEFAVLVLDAGNITTDILIERLERKIGAFNRSSQKEYRISLSIGVAHYHPEDPSTLDDLMVEADAKMYEQKRSKQA